MQQTRPEHCYRQTVSMEETWSKLEDRAKVRRHEMGIARWSDWTSERTGFGRLFRKRAKYPSFLPLRISSDHYVDAHTGIRDDERVPRHDIYFS